MLHLFEIIFIPMWNQENPTQFNNQMKRKMQHTHLVRHTVHARGAKDLYNLWIKV